MLEKSANCKEISTNTRGRKEMSDVALASELIREAYPPGRYGSAQRACWAAYRKLKLASERRARAIWNQEARRIDAHEMDALRRAALEEVTRERERALDRIKQLESMVAASHHHGVEAEEAGGQD